MDTITFEQILSICGPICTFLCSVTAVIISAVRKRDSNKVATYQAKFKKLLNDVLADGKITEEERRDLLGFFLTTSFTTGACAPSDEVNSNDVQN